MKWQKIYTGPYAVVKLFGPVNAVLQKTPKSKQFVVRIDKLKKCVADPLPTWGSDGGVNVPLGKVLSIIDSSVVSDPDVQDDVRDQVRVSDYDPVLHDVSDENEIFPTGNRASNGEWGSNPGAMNGEWGSHHGDDQEIVNEFRDYYPREKRLTRKPAKYRDENFLSRTVYCKSVLD